MRLQLTVGRGRRGDVRYRWISFTAPVSTTQVQLIKAVRGVGCLARETPAPRFPQARGTDQTG